MRKLIVVLALAGLAWYGYNDREPTGDMQISPQLRPAALLLEQSRQPNFVCDGRVHCSQMTSCAEATYFIKNCSGTKMDGDYDGVPCESQWCQ
jgi:hypothetical protein